MAERWTNWGGNVTAHPKALLSPRSEGEVLAAIRGAKDAGGRLRVVGAGHSFTPLVATEGPLVTLDAMTGLVDVDRAAGTATVWAGTRLRALGEALATEGLGQENMGDIDAQSIAGALGTGTHGTGAALYPRWADFAAVRRRMDPTGLFTTPYVERLLGAP